MLLLDSQWGKRVCKGSLDPLLIPSSHAKFSLLAKQWKRVGRKCIIIAWSLPNIFSEVNHRRKKRNMYSHHFFADDSSTSDCNGLDECYRMCPIRFRKVFQAALCHIVYTTHMISNRAQYLQVESGHFVNSRSRFIALQGDCTMILYRE